MEREAPTQDDRVERDLSAIIASDAGTAHARSREPAPRARSTLAARAGDDSRSGARRFGAAGRENRRSAGEAVSARGVMAGACGRTGLQRGHGRWPVAPQLVYVLAANCPASG